MTSEDKQTSQGLNQLFEIINANNNKEKLKRIVHQNHENCLVCSDDLFDKELKAIVDDTFRENK